MALIVLFLIIIIAVVASGLNEGLWGNLLNFVNVTMAALFAINFWEPAAVWMSEKVPAGRYAWDFAALWLLFMLFMFIFRGASDLLSRMKVRFLKPVDQAGGVLFSVLTGWVLVCFMAFSLHTAPLARNFLFGSFVPENTMFFLGPDRLMLGFANKMSRTTLVPLNASDVEAEAFDPRSEFLIKYASRRGAYEQVKGFSGD